MEPKTESAVWFNSSEPQTTGGLSTGNRYLSNLDEQLIGLTGAAPLGSESDTDGELRPGKKTKGRVKIKMEFIKEKLRRYTTFSKRKTGIMKKAYELSTLTGTQVMLLVASETGHVYTFATRRLQPMITSDKGKTLIQQCLNSSTPVEEREQEGSFEEAALTYAFRDGALSPADRTVKDEPSHYAFHPHEMIELSRPPQPTQTETTQQQVNNQRRFNTDQSSQHIPTAIPSYPDLHLSNESSRGLQPQRRPAQTLPPKSSASSAKIARVRTKPKARPPPPQQPWQQHVTKLPLSGDCQLRPSSDGCSLVLVRMSDYNEEDRTQVAFPDHGLS